jgi:hypothetical protein
VPVPDTEKFVPSRQFGSPELPSAAAGATMFVMGVTYELIDAPYPYLCAVYRCVCGGVAVRHGGDSATPPERWERDPVDGAEEQFLCPGCAAEARRQAAAADPPA